MRAGFLNSNIYTVRVVITDLAGNRTESSGQIVIAVVPPPPAPTPLEPLRPRPEATPVQPWSDAAHHSARDAGEGRSDRADKPGARGWGSAGTGGQSWSQPRPVSQMDMSASPIDDSYVSARPWIDRWMNVSTTLASGFPVLVNERATELAVYKGVGDIRVVLGRVVSVDIPGDAFVHHNPSA